MPWSQTSPMDQRVQFIADYLRESLSIADLCALYGVSRKTGYKWIDRYLRHGPAGLEECSRKPRVSPNQTPAELVAAILVPRLYECEIIQGRWTQCHHAFRLALRRRRTTRYTIALTRSTKPPRPHCSSRDSSDGYRIGTR